MYCTQCGYKMDDGTKMCPVCGHEVGSADTAGAVKINEQNSGSEQIFNGQNSTGYMDMGGKAADSTWGNTSAGGYSYNENKYGAEMKNTGPAVNNQTNYQAPIPNTMNFSGQNTPPVKPPEKKGGNKAALIVICCIVVVAIAAIAGFFIFSGQNKTSSDYDNNKNTTENFTEDNDSTEDNSSENNQGDINLSDDVDFYKGSVSNGVYTNEYFDITYNIPSTYYTLSESEIIEFYGDDNDDIEYGVIGLDVLDENFNETVIYSQEFPYYSEELYLQSVIMNATSGLDSSDYITHDEGSVTIGGKTFKCKVVELVNYDPNVEYRYTAYYVFEKDDIFLMLRCVYDDQADCDAMLENFE